MTDCGGQGDVQGQVERLENLLKLRTQERDEVKTKLVFADIEISTLKEKLNASANVSDMKVSNSSQQHDLDLETLQKENDDLKGIITNMNEVIKDKTTVCTNHERRSEALNKQVSSLKEVIGITKDMLGIRNMEVQHLQSDIESLEKRISDERERHNQILLRMDDAIKLNGELKKEYESQLKIFAELKEKYERKIVLLTESKEKNASTKEARSQETQTYDFGKVVIDMSIDNIVVPMQSETEKSNSSTNTEGV